MNILPLSYMDATIVFIAFITASSTLFLNYCFGKPGGEFSPYEIFSFYSVKLSVRRLQKIDLYDQYISQYNDNLTRANTKHEIIALNNDFKKMLYNAADPFFTWERAAGMCPICFGFWVSLAGGIIFTKNIVFLLIIIVISHIFIRVLSKII